MFRFGRFNRNAGNPFAAAQTGSFAEVLALIRQGDAIMATLADIKTKLDALADSEAKLEAFQVLADRPGLRAVQA